MLTFEPRTADIKLSDRVTVTVKELNAAEADAADALVNAQISNQSLLMNRIADAWAFCAITHINGDVPVKVVNPMTYGALRSKFSIQEAQKLTREYAERFLSIDDEQTKDVVVKE